MKLQWYASWAFAVVWMARGIPPLALGLAVVIPELAFMRKRLPPAVIDGDFIFLAKVNLRNLQGMSESS